MGKKEEKYVDDEDNQQSSQVTLCDRGIWCFYKWGVIVAPLALMFSHWYIFYVFSQNPHELMKYSEANEICIAWIYSILYLYVPLMLLPASYFFKKCDLFRIPFVYFIFINMERLQYGSWFCTNEMIETHFVLIKCIIGIYGFEMLGMFLKNLSNIYRIGKNFIDFAWGCLKSSISWIKNKLFSYTDDEERGMEELSLHLLNERLKREEET